MIKLFSFLIIMSLISCKKKEVEKNKFYEELALQRSEILLERIGKKYYEKNCINCHRGKDAKDNFLINSVRNQKTNERFYIDFITKQDSLLEYGNKEALILKDWSNHNAYIHSFDFNDREVNAILYYLRK